MFCCLAWVQTRLDTFTDHYNKVSENSMTVMLKTKQRICLILGLGGHVCRPCCIMKLFSGREMRSLICSKNLVSPGGCSHLSVSPLMGCFFFISFITCVCFILSLSAICFSALLGTSRWVQQHDLIYDGWECSRGQDNATIEPAHSAVPTQSFMMSEMQESVGYCFGTVSEEMETREMIVHRSNKN